MARPIKDNADYFSHDADMRHDLKIKAVRKKFGITGYAIYCMVLETLTDQDFFQLEYSDLSLELMAGDFDLDPELIKQIIDYCIKLDLFQLNNETSLKCKTLENRFKSLLSKRKSERKGVIEVDNTQSKVKDSKVDEIKENYNKTNSQNFLNNFLSELQNSNIINEIARKNQIPFDLVKAVIPLFNKISSESETDYQKYNDVLNHFCEVVISDQDVALYLLDTTGKIQTEVKI